MRFALRSTFSRASESVGITEQEFNTSKADAEVVLDILMIEDAFDLVTRSYIELESGVAEAGIDRMVLGDKNYQRFHEVRQKLALRLASLLTCAKMYLDSCAHRTGVERAAFKEATSAEFDAHFGYRLMERLRNHAQHLADIVHSVKFRATWNDGEGESQLIYGVSIYVNPKELRENPKLAKFRQELSEVDQPIDLIACARAYIEYISRIHRSLRGLFQPELQRALEFLESIIERFEKVAPDAAGFGVASAKEDDEGNRQDHVDIT